MNFGRNSVNDKLNENKKNNERLKRSGGLLALQLLLAAVAAVVIMGICFCIGSYHAVIDSSPDIKDVNIMPMGQATFIYDADGNLVQQLNSAEGNRISVSIESIPLSMQHAIVAIEDSRFYEHNGVDPKGMLRALAVAIKTGLQRTEGASTITQQLLKNNVFTNWTEEGTMARIRRKIQEQYLAVKLEEYLKSTGADPKAVILENYLNTVNFGAGCYGVETASQKYFGKNVEDLTLSECAVLAAIPQNPTKYNPINHPDYNKERRDIVLSKMLEQGFATEAEVAEARADDVYSRIMTHEQSAVVQPYSYFTDELIGQVRKALIEKLGYTEVQAKTALYSGGLRIYTTQDTQIQQILEEEFTNEANFPESFNIGLDWALTLDHADGTRENYSREMLQKYFRQFDPYFDLIFASQEEAQAYIDQYKAAIIQPTDTVVAERSSFVPQPQACMTVIDQKTGQVKGIVGGRGQKTASLTLNRATDSCRQPGSTFKILSTYGPALDLGKINLATQIVDEPIEYENGGLVHNSDGAYHGSVSIRNAITNSYNVVAIKVLTDITPQVGFDYLTQMGFTTLINDKDWDVIQPLALGGITNGVSNLELTAAYAAIANKGMYTEPTFYTKVTDSDGNVLLETTPESHRVFKESTAFLLTSAMEDVVNMGTGTLCKLNGMTLAGKTGTTTSYVDLVFAGFTPHYTAAIWAGYDVNAELPEGERDFHKLLYARVMDRIDETKQLPDDTFRPPTTVKQTKICSKTGLLAGLGCAPTTEYFEVSQAPTRRCWSCFVPTPTPTPTPRHTVTPTPSLTPTPSPTEGAEEGETEREGGGSFWDLLFGTLTPPRP